MARSLDGSSGKLTNATALSSFVSASTGTVALWYRPAGSPSTRANVWEDGALFSDGGNGYFGLHRANISSAGDKVYAFNYDGAENKVSFPCTVGQWDHWAMVHTGGNLLLYKNGVQVGTVAAGNTQNLTGTIACGQSTIDFLQGDVSRLATWNEALTAAEITQLVAGIAPATAHASGLTGDWRIAGSASPEPDLAAGNHALTVTGTAQVADPPLSGFYARQTVVTTANAADNSSASFAIAPLAGSAIAVCVEGWRATGSGGFDMPVGGVTDNQGNPAYTRAVQSALGSDGEVRAAIFYAYNIASSGTFMVTVDPTGTGNYFIWSMTEILGATTTDPLDKTTSNTGSSTSPSTGTTATLTQADEIAFSVLAFQNNSTITVESVSPNWDTVFEQEVDAFEPGAVQRRIVAATTAQSTAWTLGTSNVWVACIATFKKASTGPTFVLYNKGAAGILDHSINLSTATLKVMLVTSAYTPDADHDFASTPASAEISVSGYSRQTLANKVFAEDDTNDRATMDANDVTWATLASGPTVTGAILFNDAGGADSARVLIAYYALTPYATAGVGLQIIFDVSGLLRF